MMWYNTISEVQEVKKFFLSKGNKIFFIMISLLFTQAIFPITFKYDTGENLVTKKKEEDAKEKRIKSVLNAIRRHNNKYVQFYLAIEKNIKNRCIVFSNIFFILRLW